MDTKKGAEKMDIENLCSQLSQRKISAAIFEAFQDLCADGNPEAKENVKRAEAAAGEWYSQFNSDCRQYTRLSTSPEGEKIGAEGCADLVKLKPERMTFDDADRGKIFAEVFRDSLRWNVSAREWWHYNGEIWEEDTGGIIAARAAKELTDALRLYALKIKDEEVQNRFSKKLLSLGQRRNRQNMIEDAKDVYFVSSEMMDAAPDLLNVKNGVLNLKTFELSPHRPADLMTKICNVSFDPKAVPEAWDKFMGEVMQGDNDKIEFLRRIAGYALTGEAKEETLFILYGESTRNGKSTFIETLAYMLGGAKGYAMSIDPEALAARTRDTRQASPEIARLKGCRLLSASEPSKRMLLNASLVKSLTGRDTITARALYQEVTEFTPCFKLIMNTNYLPLVTDDSLFSSGRINVITFDRHFEPEEQNRDLKEELRTPEALSGILNWCLAGLERYREKGLRPPEAIQAATQNYRSISDKIGSFISEQLEPSKSNVKGKDVYLEYKRWCDDNGYAAENKGNFYAELRSRKLMLKFGTVDGSTEHNVVPGYKIRREFDRAEETPFDKYRKEVRA